MLGSVCYRLEAVFGTTERVNRLERGEHRELNVVLPAVLPLLAVPTYRTAIFQGLSNVYGSTALSSVRLRSFS